MKLDPMATTLFCSITLVTAILTYECSKKPEAVNPVFANAGLPLPLKTKLMDQIRIDNGVLVEASETLQANLSCSAPPDPDQIATLTKHVQQALNDSYAVLAEAEATK